MLKYIDDIFQKMILIIIGGILLAIDRANSQSIEKIIVFGTYQENNEKIYSD